MAVVFDDGFWRWVFGDGFGEMAMTDGVHRSWQMLTKHERRHAVVVGNVDLCAELDEQGHRVLMAFEWGHVKSGTPMAGWK